MSNTSREDVIKLAREAGLAEVTDTADSLPADYVEALAKLCALAVAKEREEMMGRIRHLLIQAEQRGAEAEREECAKVCETTAWTSSIDEWRDMTKKDVADKSMHACAAAIRARSNT